MKKSIYVFGKVYDLEKELLEDIQNDVRARIKEHTSVDIPCYINIDEANKQVDVMLIRGCSQNFYSKVLRSALLFIMILMTLRMAIKKKQKPKKRVELKIWRFLKPRHY
mgnify:CR=1 FL=1